MPVMGGSSISDKEDKEDDPEGGALTFGLGVAGAATVLPSFPTIFSSSNFSLLFSASGDARSASRPFNTLGFVSGVVDVCRLGLRIFSTARTADRSRRHHRRRNQCSVCWS